MSISNSKSTEISNRIDEIQSNAETLFEELKKLSEEHSTLRQELKQRMEEFS